MPQRQHYAPYRVESTEVQGDDSYVVLRRLTVGEMDKLDDQREKKKLSMHRYGKLLLAARIVEWNWVDDNGEPLPLPKADPTVMDKLLEHEIDFLLKSSNEAGPTEESIKN